MFTFTFTNFYYRQNPATITRHDFTNVKSGPKQGKYTYNLQI
jgi:hypothetical protein